MRICLVYDCLYPHTVGGAERWYRNLAERLAAAGHEVTYVTLRQWDPRGRSRSAGRSRRRRRSADGAVRQWKAPPICRRLSSELGVLRHLLGRGRRYDVVHTASFPFFSLLAAGLARRRGGYRIVVDWHEVWTREYWREYLGTRHRACRLARAAPLRAYRRSRFLLRAARMHSGFATLGFRGAVTVSKASTQGRSAHPSRGPAEPLVVFAGRHIPEKRVPALVPALARAVNGSRTSRGALRRWARARPSAAAHRR